MMGDNSTDVDVVIVGCGPTGATLSLLLARAGVTSHIIERERNLYPLPRAVHFDGQIMRVFQTIGIADALNKVVRFNPGMRFFDPEGTLLLDWPRPTQVGEDGWHTSYRFHQPDLESLLRSAINQSSLIGLQTGAEVVAVKQTELSVKVSYTLGDDNNKETIRAKYVVGCDGARSAIRQQINPDMHDFGFNEHWLVIDALLKTPKPELGDFTIQYCGAERPATYVRGPNNRRRWEISLKPEDQLDSFKHTDACWALLENWISPDDAIIERSAVYEFNSAIASQWRDRRLLIAGDAAHLTPPFMGQGMCSGIRDVYNLAWKLARCCRQGNDSLLDSYETERVPHVTEYITTAIKLGAVINSCSTQESLSQAFTQDDGTVQMKSLNPRLGPGIGENADAHRGQWFAQARLSNGELMDDVVGYEPVLITLNAIRETCEAQLKISHLQCKLLAADSEPDLRRLLHKLNSLAILIRPDRYIAASAQSANQLDALLKALTAISPQH